MTKLVSEVRRRGESSLLTVVQVLIDTGDVSKIETSEMPCVILTFKNGVQMVCAGTPEEFEAEKAKG